MTKLCVSKSITFHIFFLDVHYIKWISNNSKNVYVRKCLYIPNVEPWLVKGADDLWTAVVAERWIESDIKQTLMFDTIVLITILRFLYLQSLNRIGVSLTKWWWTFLFQGIYYVLGVELWWETSSVVIWTSLVVNVRKLELSSSVRNVHKNKKMYFFEHWSKMFFIE